MKTFNLKYLIIAFLALSLASCEKDYKEVVSGYAYYPVVVINGSTEMKIPKGGTYTEEGATASSNGIDLPVEVTYTSIFNPSAIGVETGSVDVYSVSYSAIDEDGDRTTEYRNVYITSNGNMVDNIEGTYISNTGRPSESFTGLKYVIVSKRADGKYDLSHAIGGYYALGRKYGSPYAFIGSVITDDGGGVYSATGGQAPAWGNISLPSAFVVDADAKTIGFTSTADFGSVFTVLLTQDSSFD